MIKAPAFLLLSLALAGCAVGPQAHLTPDPAFKPARYAWDGAGEDPNKPRMASERSRATRSAARSEQAEARDGIEVDHEARLNRSIVICKGCLPQQPPSEDKRLAKAID